MLHVQFFTFNPFQENTYVIWSDQNDAIIIDPGCSNEEEQRVLSQFVKDSKLKVKRLINTHCHIDHVLGNAWVCREYAVEPEYHPLEDKQLEQVANYAHIYGFHGYDPSPKAVAYLRPGDIIELGEDELRVLFVPGHAPGHIALYSEEYKFVINGDCLFFGSVGRTDLPGGDFHVLENSIKTQLYTLPDDVVVYCGHGDETSIGNEKRYNPFVSIQ
jgi:glyoxylase-like metal-dependent hydrolase (beta-lactamase superfamily II)